LEARFLDIFTQKTAYVTLNMALETIHKNKKPLLRVLARPEIPLHNNVSESDLREYVKDGKSVVVPEVNRDGALGYLHQLEEDL